MSDKGESPEDKQQRSNSAWLALLGYYGDARREITRLTAELRRLRAENRWLKSRHQVISAKMDGQHVWRAANRWPSLVGPTIDEAVRAAMQTEREASRDS